jgi:cysteinyl-tRNA synthetase
MHVGNLRTFVFSDILLRVLKYNNFQVEAAQNITDIDDKIIQKAKEEGKEIGEITKEYTRYFLEDVKKLNINLENLKEQPRATAYIEKMISFIQVLVEKGFAYVEKDARLQTSEPARQSPNGSSQMADGRSDGGQGSVYFDISKFPNYGQLSGVQNRELKTGTRILSDEYSKDDVQDFALWKAVGDDEVGYDSSWGKGRPGWHIECSVMSQSILGEKIDIHAGGIDLIFPHHENEIAQSEAKTGKSPCVKYWVHGAHMLVDGKKMSKSLHNFYTLSEIVDRGFSPLALRYLFLQTHYRQEMNFTFEALEAAQNALNRLRKEITGFGEGSSSIPEYEERFLEAVNDDLSMPKALSILWEVVRSGKSVSEKAATVFRMDEVLGLSLKDSSSIVQEQGKVPTEVQKLLEKREKLRQEKKFAEADKIREEILAMGYKVEDLPAGR